MYTVSHETIQLACRISSDKKIPGTKPGILFVSDFIFVIETDLRILLTR